MFIFYLVGAALCFTFGIGAVEKPTVVLMEQGKVVQCRRMNSPILVINDGVKVEVREVKDSLENSLISQKTFPFRKDSFGDWTVDCSGECEGRP